MSLSCTIVGVKLINRVGGMIFLRVPESPRWLVAKGRHAEALAVLAALDGTTVTDPLVQKTWRGIVDAVRHSAGDFAIKELFTHGRSQHFRRTMLGVGAQVGGTTNLCVLLMFRHSNN